MLFDNIVFVYGRIHDYKKDIQAEGRGESEKGESRRLGGKGNMILEDFASDWYWDSPVKVSPLARVY